MYEVRIILNVLTPLYMFGAHQTSPEIRSSEFKGMMRFWWRALRCCENYIELKSREEKIFGGVSDNSGKSKIKISINGCRDLQIFNSLKEEYNLQYNFNNKKRILEGTERGIAYMLYSVISKSGFKPGGIVPLVLYSKEDEALKNAVAALWCAVNLGGFGARARRGAGSLSVAYIEGSTYGLDFMPKGENSNELAQWITANVYKAANIVGVVNNNCKAYSNLSTSSFIISSQSYSSWIEALSAAGNIYLDFRYNRRDNIQSAVFGLPIVHRSNSSTIAGSINDKGIGRRSSPLLFKIVKCSDKYYWMVLRFTGKFLPAGAKLIWYESKKINGKNIKDILETEEPSYTMFEEFWRSIKNGNGEYCLNLGDDRL